MKYTLFKKLTTVFLFFHSSLLYCPMSEVYNLRIATTTKPRQLERDQYQNLAIGTQFQTFRKKFNHNTHRAIGALAGYVHFHDPFYIRIDGAVAQVKEHNVHTGSCFARTQTDDLLFTGGYGHAFNENRSMTISGLFGVPTHKTRILIPFNLGMVILV